jgi:hypothetical protein
MIGMLRSSRVKLLAGILQADRVCFLPRVLGQAADASDTAVLASHLFSSHSPVAVSAGAGAGQWPAVVLPRSSAAACA